MGGREYWDCGSGSASNPQVSLISTTVRLSGRPGPTGSFPVGQGQGGRVNTRSVKRIVEVDVITELE